MREESLRRRLERRLGRLRSDRQEWEPHWRDLAAHILPRRGVFLEPEVRGGQRINTRIIDGTATFAARTLAAGLMSGVTSPSRPWFRLIAKDASLSGDGDVRRWLADQERALSQTLGSSNLYTALHSAYEDLAVFGTAVILITPDEKKKVRAHTVPIGGYFLGVGADGRVDTLYREISLSVAEIADRFGLDGASERVKALAERGDWDTRVPVVHAIEPRRVYDPRRVDALNMPFRSVYWEATAAGETTLHEGGFNRFPALVVRWAVTGDEAYGRSPGMDALGDVKQLQLEQRRKAQAIDKMVNPPMVAPVSMQHAHATVMPGGITYVQDAELAKASFRPAYEVQPRLSEMADDIKEVQGRINRAFHADLFLMLSDSDRRQFTAREIGERRSEKMLALGPVLERLQGELLQPLLALVFARLVEAGEIDEAPEALVERGMTLDLQSMLARDQRIDAITAIEKLLTLGANIASISPDALDRIDPDQLLEEYAGLVGVPPAVLRDDEALEAFRTDQDEETEDHEASQEGDVSPDAGGMPAPPGIASLMAGAPEQPGMDMSSLSALLSQAMAAMGPASGQTGMGPEAALALPSLPFDPTLGAVQATPGTMTIPTQ